MDRPQQGDRKPIPLALGFLIPRQPFGIANVMVNLAVELARRVEHAEAFLVGGSQDDSLRDRLVCNGVSAREVPASTGKDEFRRWLANARLSVAISGSFPLNLALLDLKSTMAEPMSVVITLHRHFGGHLHRLSTQARIAYMATAQAYYRRADAVVAVSRGVLEDMERLIGEWPVVKAVIPNPIITSEFEQRLQEPLAEEEREQGTPLYVASGRLAPEKGFDVLVKAFSLLRQPTSRLMILGEGRERPKLQRLIAEEGLNDRVFLVGHKPNPLPFMRRSDVFVLSSTVEGAPSVLVEALASGTRVVSTECQAGPREILQDGRFGWLVPVGDPKALAKAMRSAASSPRLDPTAREAAISPYKAVEAGRRYLDVLRQL